VLRAPEHEWSHCSTDTQPLHLHPQQQVRRLLPPPPFLAAPSTMNMHNVKSISVVFCSVYVDSASYVGSAS